MIQYVILALYIYIDRDDSLLFFSNTIAPVYPYGDHIQMAKGKLRLRIQGIHFLYLT